MSCCGCEFTRGKTKEATTVGSSLWMHCQHVSLCLLVYVCDPVCDRQIEMCIWDGRDNFASWLKTSARLLKFQPYPFSCWALKSGDSVIKKTVVARVHLCHVLRLAFTLTWNTTVYQTHLYVCLEMGRFGINPSAAQWGRGLLSVCSSAERELTTTQCSCLTSEMDASFLTRL